MVRGLIQQVTMLLDVIMHAIRMYVIPRISASASYFVIQLSNHTIYTCASDYSAIPQFMDDLFFWFESIAVECMLKNVANDFPQYSHQGDLRMIGLDGACVVCHNEISSEPPNPSPPHAPSTLEM